MSDVHLERLYTQLSQSNDAMDQMIRTMDPMNPEEQLEFFKMHMQNHLIGSALGGALTSRHNLLKKIISEIR